MAERHKTPPARAPAAALRQLEVKGQRLPEIAARIYAAIAAPKTVEAVCQAVGISHVTARKYLALLVKAKLATAEQPPRGAGQVGASPIVFKAV